MSQYNFGTIDPYVVDGVQLAGMLNQWRDAIHSWHRGPTVPTYVVPGMMWIDDSAGAAAWKVMVYMSAGLGSREIFRYDTTTGAITLTAAAAGTFAAAQLLASGTAPSVGLTKTDNAADVKRWSASVNGAGALVLACLTDAGVVQQSFTFNRDGSVSPSLALPSFRLRATAADTLSGPAMLDFFRSAATPVKDFDTGNNVVISAGGAVFTAPRAARYKFDAALYTGAAGAAPFATFIRHMTSGSVLIRDYAGGGYVPAVGVGVSALSAALIDMANGEKVSFQWVGYSAGLYTTVPVSGGTGAGAALIWAHGYQVPSI